MNPHSNHGPHPLNEGQSPAAARPAAETSGSASVSAADPDFTPFVEIYLASLVTWFSVAPNHPVFSLPGADAFFALAQDEIDQMALDYAVRLVATGTPGVALTLLGTLLFDHAAELRQLLDSRIASRWRDHGIVRHDAGSEFGGQAVDGHGIAAPH